jgi:hypothetical protein
LHRPKSGHFRGSKWTAESQEVTASKPDTSLLNSSWPINPILGQSVPVGNGQNPDHLIPDNVGSVVGKYLEVNPPIAAGSQAWHLGILRYPGDMLVHLLPESQTQPLSSPS